ncbi:CLUMA_CG017706, isoform A [Clunio marinus]|uniref:CLUMA_CG017706, isoform A n=1 Tax=Clunio marinus TaxID=568069 RepID=A0A1J1IWV4_9DIPT|nr:CLUMA_CG017706, isoform A [Clunio marinus]
MRQSRRFCRSSAWFHSNGDLEELNGIKRHSTFLKVLENFYLVEECAEVIFFGCSNILRTKQNVRKKNFLLEDQITEYFNKQQLLTLQLIFYISSLDPFQKRRRKYPSADRLSSIREGTSRSPLCVCVDCFYLQDKISSKHTEY